MADKYHQPRQSSSAEGESGEKKAELTEKVPSREAVISNILKEYSVEQEDLEDPHRNEHELRRLTQAITNLEGRFGLLFGICNSAPERERLTQQIVERLSLQNQKPIVVRLDRGNRSLLETLLTAPGYTAPLIALGIEKLLPSSEEDSQLQEQTLSELQLGRERFRRLGQPLLLWMPEYTYSLIGQKAVDFWSWQTGVFIFVSPHLSAGEAQFKTFENQDSHYSLWEHFGTDSYVLGPAEYRPHVNEVINSLRQGRSVLIRGAGGMGKTALAYSIARRVSADATNLFPDAQLFINLGDPKFADSSSLTSGVIEGFRQVIRTLRPDLVALPDDAAGLAATYQHVLEGKRALIVVDGVADADTLRLFIPPYKSALLATSGAEMVPLREIEVVDLDRLTEEQGRELLHRIIPSIDQATADEICTLCGYQPLAIRIAGNTIVKQPEMTPAILIELLRNYLNIYKGQPWKDRGSRVEAVLSIAYERLPPEVSLTFSKLAIFPSSFDFLAEETICDDERNMHLRELIDRGLVLVDGLSGRYDLHPLVRQFAARHLKNDESLDVGRKHSWYFAQVLSVTNNHYRQGGEHAALGLKVFEDEWENIKAGQSWAAAHLEGDTLALELCNSYPYVGRDLLELRQHPKERIPWIQAALSAARVLGDRQSEASHLCLMGIAYTSLREISTAANFFNQALELAREAGSKQIESVALANLGITYQEQGRSREAVNIYEEALVSAREIGDLRSEVSILGHLGDIYVSLAEYAHAIKTLEKSLEVIRQLGDVRREATVLSGLGNAYSSMGESLRAIEYYEQSLALARKVNYRHGEAAALSNLGLAYQNIGESFKAIPFYEQALDIFREIGDPRGEANATGNLAISYAQLGDYSSAVDRFTRMLDMVREAGNREGEAVALCNLGFVFNVLGDNKRARTLFEQALEIMRQIEDRHGEAKALSGIANTYANEGDSAQAINFYKQALSIDREIGSRRNEAYVLNNLGYASANAGQLDEALSYFEQALSIARKIGSQRIEADALWNVSQATFQLGDLSLARKYAEEALTIYNKIQDPNATKILTVISQWPASK